MTASGRRVIFFADTELFGGGWRGSTGMGRCWLRGTDGGPTHRLRLVVLAGLVLLASACSDAQVADEEPSSPVGQPAEGAGDTTIPVAGADRLVMDPTDAVFVDGDCPFDPPPDTSPRCGTVTVPENWAVDGTGWIQLAAAVFPGPDDYGAVDPVVYLSGGPGQHSLDSLSGLMDIVIRPLQRRSDVVFFDQRGVGYTTPSLDCFELSMAESVLVGPAESAAGPARFQDSVRQCRSRLVAEGRDLGAYNSLNSAHDVEAIRAALGYRRWNLYGVSYGTRLALEVVRQHPDGVRSMVLDSVLPPEVDLVRDLPTNALAAYQQFVETCSREPACGTGGDMAERIRGVVSNFDAKPVDVAVLDYVHGGSKVVRVTGEVVEAVVTTALSSPFYVQDLPELIAELEAGRTAALGHYLSSTIAAEGEVSSGVLIAYDCNEEVPFADEAQVTAARRKDPFGRKAWFEHHAVNAGLPAFALCDAFGLGTPDPVLNQPVVSNVPTLLLAGANDPLTPPAWARQAAGNLSSSYVVIVPGQGHGVSFDTCVMDTILYFLDWPSVEPRRACLNVDSGLFNTETVAAAPDLGPATFPAAVGSGEVATVQPRSWFGAGMSEIAWRQASFLDPTMVYQVAGDPVTAGRAEVFLAEGWGVELSDPELVRRGNRRWIHRRGSGDYSSVEWYQTERQGFTIVVVLMTSPPELDAMIGDVLLPALDQIDVTS